MNPWKTLFLVELEQNKRLFIILFSVFGFFSITGLLTQLYMEDILKASGVSVVDLPEPNLKNAFADIWGDFYFIGGIVSIFVGSKIISSEIQNGKSIYIILSRPISRSQYYWSHTIIKLFIFALVLNLITIMDYIIGVNILDSISFGDVLASSLIISLGVLSFFALLIMFNAKYTSSTTAIISIITFIGFLGLSPFVQYIDWLKFFSPFSLSDIWIDILFNSVYEEFWITFIGLLLWVSIPLGIGWYWFTNRDL